MKYYDEDNQKLLEDNKEKAVKAKCGLPLKALLSAYTVERLKVLAAQYHLSNRSKMKKQELVEGLAVEILNPRKMSDWIILMKEDEYQLFLAIVQGNDFANKALYPGCYSYMQDRGYLFLLIDKGTLFYEVPEEVKTLFTAVLADEEHNKRAADIQMKVEFMTAAINLYGLITFEQLTELYNGYYEQPLKVKDFETMYQLYNKRQQFIEFCQGYLVAQYLLIDDAFERMQAEIIDVPAYVPDLDEFLMYADELYLRIATPQDQALMSYLTTALALPEADAAELLEDIHLMAEMEYEFVELFDMFEDYGVVFKTTQQIKRAGELLIDLMNHSRLLSKRGRTLAQMHELTGEALNRLPQMAADEQMQQTIQAEPQRPIHVEKVGRNAPCPCGSGQKYKKCCGK